MLNKIWQYTKKTSANLAMFCISLFIALVLGEFIIRWVKPQQLIVLNNDIWQPDSTYGWSTKPLVNTMVNTGEKPVHFYSDEHGFRISSPEQAKQANDSVFSVLTLGDSFLEAAQVENEYTMNEQMASMLKEQNGKQVYFANTGVGGWSPNQYLLRARSELKRRKYDLGIVYIFTGNDIIGKLDTLLQPKAPSIDHKFGFPRLFVLNSWKKKVFYPLNDYLERHSHLFILAKNSLQVLLTKAGFSAVYFPKSFIQSDDVLQAYEVTQTACSLIKAEFDKHQTPVYFVLLPHRIQLYPVVFEKYKQMFDLSKMTIDLNLPNTKFKQMSDSLGIQVLDPTAAMAEESAKGIEYYGKIDFHFNEAGHKAVGQFLLPHVAKQIEQASQGGNLKQPATK